MGTRNRHRYKDENCFFVTTTCKQWLPLIEYADAYTLIKDSLTFVNEKFCADILAYVIMPNHLHLIIFFKESNELSNYMRDFKKYTSTGIRKLLEEKGLHNLVENLRVQHPKRVFQIWEERFDDLYLRSPQVLATKLDYIHCNPLQERWNLAERPELYSHSSASYYENGADGQLKVRHYRNFF